MKLIRLFSAWFTAAMLASCGSSIGQTETFNCCINKQFYSCPDQDSFTQCVGNDVSACQRDATGDVGCRSPWPGGPYCCIDQKFYVCADQASFDQCFTKAISGTCTHDPVKDSRCPAPWPG